MTQQQQGRVLSRTPGSKALIGRQYATNEDIRESDPRDDRGLTPYSGLGLLGRSGQGHMKEPALAAATTARVHSIPTGAGANNLWAVFLTYDTNTEVRKITGVSNSPDGVDITWSGGLTYAHAAGDAVMFIDKPVLNVKWWGATGDGSTDDSTAINRCIAQAEAATGETHYATGLAAQVDFPAGQYAIGSALDEWPKYINIYGQGSGLTVFKLTASGAKISIANTTDTNQRGGEIGGFTIDGNSTGTNGLYIGKAIQRQFVDIIVTGCAGDGIIIEGAQNNRFANVNSEANGTSGAGSGLVLDYGAGNNLFERCEFGDNEEYNVEIRQSGASPSGAFSVPSSNRFIGCVIERYNASMSGAIYQGNGRLNAFDMCDISLAGATGAISTVVLRRADTAKASNNLRFRSCNFSGDADYTTVFDCGGSSGYGVSLVLEGYNFFENHDTLFSVDDNTDVFVSGLFNDWSASSITTLFTNSGSNTYNQTVRSRFRNQVGLFAETASTDSVLEYFVRGDTYAALQLINRAIRLYDGSSSSYVGLSRTTKAGVNALACTAAIGVQGTNATIFAGTGAPTVGAADGSLFLRTDGAAGSTIYARVGGSWSAIA